MIRTIEILSWAIWRVSKLLINAANLNDPSSVNLLQYAQISGRQGKIQLHLFSLASYEWPTT